MSLIVKNINPAAIPTPDANKTAIGATLDSELFIKDDTGAVTIITGGSGGAAVPYFIPTDTVFRVNLYDQALFAMDITVEGTLDISGILLGVE